MLAFPFGDCHGQRDVNRAAFSGIVLNDILSDGSHVKLNFAITGDI